MKWRDSKRIVSLFVIAGVMLLLALPAVSTNKIQYILSTTYIITMASYGLYILYAYAGQLFMCQAALMGVGAYTATILVIDHGNTFWGSILPAVLLSGVIGCFVAYLVIRSHGHYFVIGTFAIGEFIVLLMTKLDMFTRGHYGIGLSQRPEGFGPIQFESVTSMYYLTLFFLMLTMVVIILIKRSSLFWKFNAIRENEPLAHSVGINSRTHKLIAAGISSLIAGFAGILLAFHTGFINPPMFASWNGVKIIFVVILGAILIGPHNILGPVLGAIIIVFLPDMLGLSPIARNLIYSGLLVMLVLASITNIFEKLKFRRWLGSAPQKDLLK